jgi:hypothetical protein
LGKRLVIERLAPLSFRQATNKLDVDSILLCFVSTTRQWHLKVKRITLSKILIAGCFAMFYLGIDIGKNNHVASMLNDEGKIVFKAFSFSNTTDGGESLYKRIMEACSDASKVEIGMEATGHYWLAVYSFLISKDFVIHVVNAIQTDGWRKGVEIRKRKTDAIDSILIADLILYGSFVETQLADENLMSLKTLTLV